MGGGPKPELVIMPFEEPTKIFDRIRKNHPNIKITFKSLLFTNTPWIGKEAIPEGLNDIHSAASQSLAVTHDC